MFKKLLVFAFVFALAFAIVGIGSAALPGSGWWQGATFQNVGQGSTNVQVVAYDSASASTYPTDPATISLAEGASTVILPDDFAGMPAGFQGSAIASAGQPLAALVNVTNREAAGFGVPGGKAAGIYNGVPAENTATTVNFPLAKHNHFGKTTTFYLQNAGGAGATIDVTFVVNGTNYPYTTPSVDPGQMVAVEPGLAGVPSGNGNIGAMSATSSQSIAGVMIEHQHSAAVATVIQASGSFIDANQEAVMYCPLYKVNYFGRNSGMNVQNVHGTAQDVTAYFIAQNGTETPSTENIPAGGAVTFYQPAGVADGIYAVRLEAELGPIAAVVNESELPLPAGKLQTSTTYACSGDSSATTRVSYPAYKENWFGRQVGMQVQNVGSATATTVVMTFIDNNNNTYVTDPQSVAAGAALNIVNAAQMNIWNGAALPDGTISGVIVTADQPLLVVANEASWSGTSPETGPSAFDKANAVGFNLVPLP